MLKRFLVLSWLIFTIPAASWAEGGPFGLGVILGDPTGISLAGRFDQHHGLQAHVGFGIGHGGHFTIVGDYLYHIVSEPVGQAGHLSPYLGVGGKIGVRDGNDNVLVGVRVPLGLSLFLRPVPIELAIEVAVGLNIVPSTSALVDGGFIARWYF